MKITIGGQDFDFSRQVYLMGILNVTPDSFSDGGHFIDPEKALDRAIRMQEEGADLVDLGGESTRPGAEPVSFEEEKNRIVPVLKKLASRLKIPVSIDTQKSAIAALAVAEGASLINDVSALADPDMATVASKAQVPVILMHRKGSSKDMQDNPVYEDVVSEIAQFLASKIHFALESGIAKNKILIDPGIGFGKRFEDNLTLLKHLSEFLKLNCPVVFGSSRKSFVRKIMGEKPSEILLGSVATALMAAERGATLLRVHDIKETKRAMTLISEPRQSAL